MTKNLMITCTLVLSCLSGQCQSESKNTINTSGITSIEVKEANINNLALLCKVWGLLKYYHPAVAEGKYNMDIELFLIMKELLSVKNNSERDRMLTGWVDKFGEMQEGKVSDIDSGQIKLKPDFTWINTSTFSKSLSGKLQKIITANRRKTDFHFYFTLAPQVKNVVIRYEERFDSTAYPDAGVRLLSLFRYWNIIQYFFPYKYLTNDNWNDVLKKFIPRFINSKSELDYKLNVLSLITHVNDTHANIYGDTTLHKFIGRNTVPADIRFIENKAVVNEVFSVNGKKATALLKGDVLDSVNGKSIEELVKMKLPYTAASNNSTALRNIGMELLRSNDTLLNITFTRNGKKYSSVAKCFAGSSFNTMLIYQRIDTCFKLITPDIAYIYPGSIKNKYLPDIMPEVLKTKGLIIDLRCYPSEFIVFSLSEYLMPEPVEFVKFSKTDINQPGLFTFTEPYKVGKSNPDYYKGKVVILINEITQSQAEYTTMAFRQAPSAVVIGSTTAAADGNISHIQLPGGIHTVITGIGVYYPDGKATQRIGIIPDLEVKQTIKGIRENRDELVEKAIAIINGRG